MAPVGILPLEADCIQNVRIGPEKSFWYANCLQSLSGRKPSNAVHEEAGRGMADTFDRTISRTIRSHSLATARKDTAKASIFVIMVSTSLLAYVKMVHRGKKPRMMDGSQGPTFSMWMRLYLKAQL